MKKNKMMRLASSLLVAVLLTTSVISGTFAKYVTEDTATDSARVAAWGVKVVVTGEDVVTGGSADKTKGAFSTTYTTGVETTVNSTDEVLAPGTSGSLGSVSITGEPEVMVDVTVEVDVELAGWKAKASPEDLNEVIYFPVVVTVGTENVDLSGLTELDEIEETIEEAIIEYVTGQTTYTATDAGTGFKATARYAPNTNLASAGPTDVNVNWEWPFTTGNVNDAKDTYLGDKAAGGNASSISFSCKVTVTQVD